MKPFIACDNNLVGSNSGFTVLSSLNDEPIVYNETNGRYNVTLSFAPVQSLASATHFDGDAIYKKLLMSVGRARQPANNQAELSVVYYQPLNDIEKPYKKHESIWYRKAVTYTPSNTSMPDANT